MNLMVFCSNPVNGGTARMFYESVVGLKDLFKSGNSIFPCINKGNPVEVYRLINDIIELPIESAENKYPSQFGAGFRQRVFCSLKRSILYRKTYKNNVKTICNFIEENRIDAVIIHNGGYVGDDLCNQVLEAAYKCASITRHRIYVLHSDMVKNIIAKLRFRNYDFKISREATDIVTVSEFTKRRMTISSYISKEIKVINDGINVVRKVAISELKKTIQINPACHNILMIGNFHENKGHLQFIECASLLYKKDKRYRFTIIGNIYDGKYYERCIKLIKEKSLEDMISIYQGINNASDYIAIFDIQAVPSMYDESFGLISVEAMANGVPVVAFECGGLPEVVKNGRNGFVVPVGNCHMMAEKIEYIITHNDERCSMAANCKIDYQNKFSRDSMIKQYALLLGHNSMR